MDRYGLLLNIFCKLHHGICKNEKIEIETSGQIEIEVEFQNQRAKVQLHVVKGNYASLFGCDWYLLFNIDFNKIFVRYANSKAEIKNVHAIMEVNLNAQQLVKEYADIIKKN